MSSIKRVFEQHRMIHSLCWDLANNLLRKFQNAKLLVTEHLLEEITKGIDLSDFYIRKDELVIAYLYTGKYWEERYYNEFYIPWNRIHDIDVLIEEQKKDLEKRRAILKSELYTNQV